MNLAGKITLGASALVIGGLVALAAPTVASLGQATHTVAENIGRMTGPTEPAAEPTAEPVAKPEQTPATPVSEASTPDRNSGPHLYTAAMQIDRGAIYGATGTANHDAEGNIVTYTVAPNDSLVAIGERFGLDYARILDAPVDTIHAGDILTLR